MLIVSLSSSLSLHQYQLIESYSLCVSFLQVSHIYICDHHKNMILSVRNKGRRKKESDEDGDTPEVVDAIKL